MAELLDLEVYAAHFDAVYPKYGDDRYGKIRGLVEGCRTMDHASFRDEAARVADDALAALIEVRNYKAQAPFPLRPHALMGTLVSLQSVLDRGQRLDDPEVAELFKVLIDTDGLQLPTVSAFFHFMQPEEFPIVDVNVVTSCSLLATHGHIELKDFPPLPAPGLRAATKLKKYRLQCALLEAYARRRSWTLRQLDKALMVLGNAKAREAVEKGAGSMA